MRIEESLTRVLGKGDNQILGMQHRWFTVFAQNVGGRPAIVLELPEKLPNFIDGAKGFTVLVETRGDDTSYLRIAAADKGLRPAFSALCRHLLTESAKAESFTAALEKFLDALEGFRSLLARAGGRLGEDGIRGLFAELWVLRQIIGLEVDPVTALRAWNGPFGNGKDFTFVSGHCVEVKSAHRPATKVRISSVEQLEPADITLQLAVVPIERASAKDVKAIALTSLITSLGNFVGNSAEAREMWTDALDAIKIDLTDEYYSEWWFVPGNTAVFDVIGDFPRITRESVPTGVSDLSYSLELAELAPYQSTLQLDKQLDYGE